MYRFRSSTNQLLVSATGGIARVTFNRPEHHNAFSREMRLALTAALDELNEDVAIRVIILEGAGGRAFSVGGDISKFDDERATAEGRAKYDRESPFGPELWNRITKPVIAKIQGHCIGGGLILAMHADIRIASENSAFSLPVARLGVGLSVANVRLLIDVVGTSAASEILFSGRRFDAVEAQRLGLVNRVVPSDGLFGDVDALARSIAANAPLSISSCKAAIRGIRSADTHDLSRLEALAQACFDSNDYVEGQRAFKEKRTPKFTGA